MRPYVVRITSPAGRETYLCDGREVKHMAQATRYPYPFVALQAMNDYEDSLEGPNPPVTADIFDASDLDKGPL